MQYREIEKDLDALEKSIEDLEDLWEPRITEEELLKAIASIEAFAKAQKDIEEEEAEDEREKSFEPPTVSKSYTIAKHAYEESLRNHEGERDIFGKIIVKGEIDPRTDESVPRWMRAVDNHGLDFNPREVELGTKHEMQHHTDGNPEEARQIALAHLEEIDNYYSELGRWIEDAKAQIKADEENDVRLLKALGVEPPRGMRYDEAFHRLVPLGESEIRKAEEVDRRALVEAVEQDLRKHFRLEPPVEMGQTEEDLVKALLGESSYEVYLQKYDGELTLVKCADREEAKRKAHEILSERKDRKRQEKGPKAPILKVRKQ